MLDFLTLLPSHLNVLWPVLGVFGMTDPQKGEWGSSGEEEHVRFSCSGFTDTQEGQGHGMSQLPIYCSPNSLAT